MLTTHNEKKALEKATNAVTFRRSRQYEYNYTNAATGQIGYGLGPEMLKTTFDFATMSFFDYIWRYFISIFDPNSKTRWANEKGYIDMKCGLKELGANIRVGALYAAGSDVFAALPYVYYMKFQRHALNRLSPGFELDSNYGSWGGS